MMNYPGVIAGSPAELEKLGLDGAAHVDGHAPGVLGNELQAYAAAGIGSDHEALTVEEGRERLRAGMWLLIREASMARNLLDLLPLVEELGPARIAFCTDDRDPEDIADDGHINGMVRKAVAAGIAPEDALVMASLHPALWHGLHHHGAIAPGYHADLVLLPDLVTFAPETVLKSGRPIGGTPPIEIPDWVRQSVRIRPVVAADFEIPAPRGVDPHDRSDPGSGGDNSVVVAARRRRRAHGRGRCSRSREDRGRRAAPRHRADRPRLRLRIGAGTRRPRVVRVARRPQPDRRRNDRLGHRSPSEAGRDRRRDRRRRRRRVLAECPLPIAGLLSDAPFAEVIAQSRACNDAAHALGWTRGDAVPHAFVPRTLGHPRPQDHRSRPRRRRSLRARAASGVRRRSPEVGSSRATTREPSTRPAGSSWRTA